MTDEKPWPSRFGTLGEKAGLNDADFDDMSTRCIINDEMPPTKNPLNPREIFTSKSKLRQRYKEAGVEEIGTAYDKGYKPEKIREERSQQVLKNLSEKFRYKLNHG
jgi:hypothetical protein